MSGKAEDLQATIHTPIQASTHILVQATEHIAMQATIHRTNTSDRTTIHASDHPYT